MKPSEYPQISVVVPVYNRASIMGPTLESLAAQTARDIEIIMVDNNSTDGSYELLTEWQSRTSRKGLDIIVARCSTPGASAARNCGLSLVKSDRVMFFDSDDTMPPTHVAEALAAISAHREADIIGWDYTSSDGTGSRVNRFYGRDMQWNNLFHGAMATERWCARTELVRKVGGWNENVGYWDDIELGARMLADGATVYYRGMSGVEVREHAGSITGTYCADPARIEPALQSIAATTGNAYWTDIKRAIEYGLTTRTGNGRGAELMSSLLGRYGGLRGLLLRFAYEHTRHGLRGAAALAKPFCRLFR